MRGAEHVEDAVQALLVHNVPHPDEVEVAGRDTNNKILLGDDAKN
jgi:hypothetical protein